MVDGDTLAAHGVRVALRFVWSSGPGHAPGFFFAGHEPTRGPPGRARGGGPPSRDPNAHQRPPVPRRGPSSARPHVSHSRRGGCILDCYGAGVTPCLLPAEPDEFVVIWDRCYT
jgi:hypothetical protein